MKRIALALAVFVSLMIPSTSHAEWVKVTMSPSGNTWYINTKIRKHDGHIYVWVLTDLLKPYKNGDLSAKVYHEGDCGKFRLRRLQFIFYKQPMGEGKADSQKSVDQSWVFPLPDSVDEDVLEAACKMANQP